MRDGSLVARSVAIKTFAIRSGLPSYALALDFVPPSTVEKEQRGLSLQKQIYEKFPRDFLLCHSQAFDRRGEGNAAAFASIINATLP